MGDNHCCCGCTFCDGCEHGGLYTHTVAVSIPSPTIWLDGLFTYYTYGLDIYNGTHVWSSASIADSFYLGGAYATFNTDGGPARQGPCAIQIWASVGINCFKNTPGIVDGCYMAGGLIGNLTGGGGACQFTYLNGTPRTSTPQQMITCPNMSFNGTVNPATAQYFQGASISGTVV